MACGSGRYLADLMAGVAPQISSEGLDISRYASRPARVVPHQLVDEGSDHPGGVTTC
jgi:glycine/D-amino acid oxidase-like deaminating enzyme